VTEYLNEKDFSLFFKSMVRILGTTTMIKPRTNMSKAKVGVDRNVKIPKSIKKSDIGEERAEWMRFALQNFERAYGDNEPEYTSDMIKVPNPDYERR
jgi:hypothetical protein